MNKMTNLFAVLLMFTALPTMAAPVVGFEEEQIKVNVGDTFTMNIVISGVQNTEGGGLSLVYDPAVVEVLTVSVNEAIWDFVNRSGDIDNAAGRISDILFSSYGGVSNDAVIAAIVFKAVGRGKSEMRLIESKVNPFASGGNKIAVGLGKSKVKVRGR